MSQISSADTMVKSPDLDIPQTPPATTAPGTSAAVQPPLPQDLEPTTPYAGARAAYAQVMPRQDSLHGAAAPGRTGFLDSIKRFLLALFSGVPSQVTAQMPDGGKVTFDGKSLKSMISALPMTQRAAAIAALGDTLSRRISHGKTVYDTAMQGNAAPPSEDDVADMMLYFKARAMTMGHDFKSGSYSVEDPQGTLARFLDSCPGRYQRSSTHLNAMQDAIVDGHLNTHRGIDFAPGKGLPYGQETLLFGTIPPFGSQPRRLFLRPETYGARISTLSSVKAREGAGGHADRPLRLRDVGNAIGHLGRLIIGKFTSDEGSRKERIPDGLKNQYETILDAWKSRGRQDVVDMLSKNAPLSKCGGVRVMMANLEEARLHLQGQQAGSPAVGDETL
ncbi:MAG: hypothetical protein J6P53_03340, partial [Mailhella sp.]|nr:hypothetical protein [Mailhella sp.]